MPLGRLAAQPQMRLLDFGGHVADVAALLVIRIPVYDAWMTPKQENRLRGKMQSALTHVAELVETMHDQHVIGNAENRATARAVIHMLTRFRDECEPIEVSVGEIGDEIVRTKLRVFGRIMSEAAKQKKRQKKSGN
jgi:hypothetical protein